MRRMLLALFCVTLSGLASSQEWESISLDADEATLSGAWSVSDDVIKGTAAGLETAWLQLPGEYADFEMSFEVRTEVPANGGVMIRSHWLPHTYTPDKMAMYGYQVNLDTTGRGDVGTILDENGRGRLAGPAASSMEKTSPTDWNRVLIRAVGGTVEVQVNGNIAARSQDEAYMRGAIALQLVANPVGPVPNILYRNVRIKDLGRSENWQSLFDGKSFDGWKEWGSEEWTVSDGAIHGRRGPKNSEGYLATEATWKDFHVRGEFKMLGDGNYGLFYHSTIRLREDGYPLISGIQGEVMPGRPAQTGRLYESYRRGWLMGQDHRHVGSWALREGEWNEIEIRSQGNHVTTWVNGIRVVDFVDMTPQLFEGSFALQLHAGEGAGIDWRELYVVE